MKLLLLFTFFTSVLSFDPTTDIEIKYAGWCDHWLTFEECTDPATIEAVMAMPSLKRRKSVGSTWTTDYEKEIQIKHYELADDTSYNGYTNQVGGPFQGAIRDYSSSNPAGCAIFPFTTVGTKTSGVIAEGKVYDTTFWQIGWRTMYDKYQYKLYSDRRAYIEANVDNIDEKNIYDSFACQTHNICICRKSGGLSAPDRSLPGTYYSSYEAGGGGGSSPAPGPAPSGGSSDDGSETGLTIVAFIIATLALIVGTINIVRVNKRSGTSQSLMGNQMEYQRREYRF